MVPPVKETIIMTKMTGHAAQGSKAKPATKSTDNDKARAAQPSPAIQAASDDKTYPSALQDYAAVPLPEATSDEAPPAQPIVPGTDDASDDVVEPFEPMPAATVDAAPAAPAKSPKVAPSAKASKKVPKSALVQKLLSRTRGATLAEMEEATGWQSHSVRAFLTGLRKKGLVLVREARKDGVSAYRIPA
jgi:Protein of unknown function (DUF3489)